MKVPFDKKLFQLTRLDIVANLDEEPPIPFAELRDVLSLSDGNLAAHLKVLEKQGIVALHKIFVDKKPQTTISLTEKGRQQFLKLKCWFFETFLEGW